MCVQRSSSGKICVGHAHVISIVAEQQSDPSLYISIRLCQSQPHPPCQTRVQAEPPSIEQKVVMPYLDPDLGVPYHARAFDENCEFNVQNVKNQALEIFSLAHALGWFGKVSAIACHAIGPRRLTCGS